MTSATDYPASLQWSIDHNPSDNAIQALRHELIAYNITTAAIDTSRDVAVWLRDTHGSLMGGAVGTVWGSVPGGSLSLGASQPPRPRLRP